MKKTKYGEKHHIKKAWTYLIITMKLFHVLAVLEDGREILLVLLAPAALRLHLLLLLQLLGGAGLAQTLPLSALVRLDVDGRLQRRITTGAGQHLRAQLALEIEQAQGAQFDLGLDAQVFAHRRR